MPEGLPKPRRTANRRLRRHAWVLAGALTAGALLSFAALESVERLVRPDGCDYAQIARELTEGRGFSSRQAIYLLHLRFLKEHGLLHSPWPNLHRFPLPSLALAACFLVLGPTFAAVLTYGVLFHTATALLMLFWGRRTIGLVPALGAVALFSVNATTLETGVTGLAEPVAVFFFTLSIVLAWRSGRDDRLRWPFWTGVALGLAALARTNTVLALPALAVLVSDAGRGRAPARKRMRGAVVRAALLAAGTLAAMSPWMARNWQLTGSPTFSLHSYFLVPSGTRPDGDKWDVSRPWVNTFVSPVAYVRTHPGPVLAKWARHAGAMAIHFPTFGGTRIPLLFLVGLLVPAGRGLRPVAWAVLAGFVLNVAFVSFTDRFIPKYSWHLVPAMLVVGTGVVWRGLRAFSAGRGRRLLLVPALAALIVPGSIEHLSRTLRRQGALVREPEMDFIRTHTREDSVVFSDLSYAVTWVTGRRTVRSHFSPGPDGDEILAVRQIHEEFLPIDAMYLAMRHPRTRRALEVTERDPALAALFPHRHEFADGAVFYYR